MGAIRQFALLLVVSTAFFVTVDARKRKVPSETRVVVNPPKQGSVYDFYTLAQEWYGTVCRVEECSFYKGTKPPSAVNHFNLHGLWPNALKKEQQPFDCDNTQKFHFDALPESLRDEIDLKWNGLYNPTKKFLDHEWSKHGTCWNPDEESKLTTTNSRISVIARLLSQSTPSVNEVKPEAVKSKVDVQASYLKRSLQLADQINLHKILKAEGIVPRQETYPLANVRKAVQNALGIQGLVIRCATQKDADGNKKKLLMEVRVCLDLEYNVKDCPANLLAQNDCGKDERINVYYQPFPFEE
jgi:ribonuclease I